MCVCVWLGVFVRERERLGLFKSEEINLKPLQVVVQTWLKFWPLKHDFNENIYAHGLLVKLIQSTVEWELELRKHQAQLYLPLIIRLQIGTEGGNMGLDAGWHVGSNKK
ncbi:unnamed protein product [Trifolium pratense]|uniref:Uncharacterized protein n=1 Tax=Trifolium pratense TaxID=57577 RepID=A0ACB0INA4_TRIPR|nr:unnamed protein product [Trifolium pratense]